VRARRKIRLFLDSNVLTAGFLSKWGLDKAILSLCAAQVCRLVLAKAVRDEVEDNLLACAEELPAAAADQSVHDYYRLIALMRPEIVLYPDGRLVHASRHLIRHESDVPVLLSAMASKSDWVLTHNRRHFTQEVARKCGLRIATPADFFRTLSKLLA